MGALLWLLGVEALPNLHLGLHGLLAPHEHGAPAHASARHRAHAHDDHAHEHGEHHGEHGQHAHGHAEPDHDHAEHEPEHDHDHAELRDEALPHDELRWDERDHDHAEVAPIAPRHGQHDLLHRGVAITQPPSPWPVGASAELDWVPWLPTACGRPYSNVPERARARGPPPVRTAAMALT